MKKHLHSKQIWVKPLVFSVHLAMTTGLVFSSHSAIAADTVQTRNYTIAANSLNLVLNQFAAQSDVAIAMDAKQLATIRSEGLNGNYSIADGFARILQNTNFQAQKSSTGYVIVEKEKAQVRDMGQLNPIDVNTGVRSRVGTTGNVAQLPVITVNADQNTTEGTGSYTTGKMRTATKLDLSIRETPQSVKILTQEYLQDANIDSSHKLFDSITGLSPYRSSETYSVYGRGFVVDYYLFDGVPTTDLTSDYDLVIYDRVEIVKGANGLMTGAGNPAMGMNFIRKHANSNVFKGDINISVGSWDNYNASLDVQTPLNRDGTIRTRIVAKHQDSKSFMDRYQEKRDTFYGVVDMDLTNTTLLSLGASYEKKDIDGARAGGFPAFYNGQRTNLDRSKAINADWTYSNNEIKIIYVKATQYLYDDISLNLNYSHKIVNNEEALYQIWGTNPTYNGYYWSYAGDSESKENNFDIYASIPFSLRGLEHEIVTGFMYNKDELTKSNNQYGLSLDKEIINLDESISLTAPISKNKGTLNETVQTGAYLAGKFSLMQDLKLIAGMRFSDWKYNSENNSGNRKYKNERTPYAGLIYDIDKNHSIYASYTDIFKPQTSKDKNDKILDPMVGKNYETGVKGEYFDGKLNAALSIFRIEQDGVAEIDKSGVNIVTGWTAYKAAQVVSKGVEFEVDGEITDNWNLSFGIANFEAKDAQGEKFNTTSSRTTANLFTKYKVNDDFSVGGGLNYKSKLYDMDSGEKIQQDAYVIANVMVAYDVTEDLKLQLNINNLFDKKYYEGIGFYGMHYGEPRNFNLGVKYNF